MTGPRDEAFWERVHDTFVEALDRPPTEREAFVRAALGDDHDAIAEFCSTKFSVTFPIFEKCEVKPGADRSPVWAEVDAVLGATPNWNFCKVLVDRDGRVTSFYESAVAPEDDWLREDIECLL